MSKIQIAILSFSFFFGYRAYTQNQTVNHGSSIWYQYYHTLHFSNQWMINSDMAVRHPWKGEISRLHLRTGADYRINSSLSVGAGYLIGHSRGSSANSIEHRFHQQANFTHKLSIFTVSHRLRIEQQFVSPKDDSRFWNLRHRYRLMLDVPVFKFSESSRLELSIGDEILLNKGGTAEARTFDQNRLLIGLKFSLGQHNQLNLLYHRQFSPAATDDAYNLDHILWIGVQQDLYLRK